MSGDASSPDIVIVGGGIWGLSTAYHLARSGNAGRVVVLERNAKIADETTRQAAGQIGQLRSHPVMARGVAYTLQLLTDFQENTGHDPGIQTPGSLHLALCRERIAAFEKQVETATSQDIGFEFVSDTFIRQRAPSIDTSAIEGAIYVHGDGYVNAHQTALAYGAAARDLGVEIQLNAKVSGFHFNGDQITGVQVGSADGSGDKIYEADHVVITAGPWTALVAQFVGFVPPVNGIRLQQARTVADPTLPADHPVVRIPDRSCYLRPEKGGYLFGYFDSQPTAMDPRDHPGELHTEQIEPPCELIDEARDLLSPIMPPLGQLAIEEFRQGMVSCAPDGWYVLGPVPERKGVWLGTACAAMGIAGSGAVGNWLSKWILQGDPGEDLRMMAPGRFGARASERDWIRQQCRQACANYYSLQGGATYSVGTSD